jgi:hypothetical protein
VRDARRGWARPVAAARQLLALRVDGLKLTDVRGLHLSDVGLLVPEQGRRFGLTLATDL